MSDLEIFNLSISLAKALKGEREAIADLRLLLNRHPEMFENIKDVSNVIKEVVSEPEIIRKNPRARSEHDYLAYKQLSDEKMGDIGVRNDNGTNVIFHTNKKKISELTRLKEKLKKSAVGSSISYTQAQSLDGLVDNNISPTLEDNIIPKNQKTLIDTLNKTRTITQTARVLTDILTQSKDIDFTSKIAQKSKHKLNLSRSLRLKLKNANEQRINAIFSLALKNKENTNGRY